MTLNIVRLTFPDAGERRLRIETSEDGESWRIMSGGDWRWTHGRYLTVQGVGHGRFLRVSPERIGESPVAVAEVEALCL